MSDEPIIPAPQDPEIPEQKPESLVKTSWADYENHIIPPAYIDKQRHDIQKGYFSGAHALLQAVELIVDRCNPDEAVKKLRAMREDVEETLEELKG